MALSLHPGSLPKRCLIMQSPHTACGRCGNVQGVSHYLQSLDDAYRCTSTPSTGSCVVPRAVAGAARRDQPEGCA